jgi:signal transduction histidine kinase
MGNEKTIKDKSMYKILPVLIVLFLFISANTSLYGQRVVTSEAGASMRVYSTEDGIPSNAPTNAFISNDGYLWLSTTGGTVRISGNEIEDFGAEHGIPLMRDIYYDRARDNIWFTDSETLIKFDGSNLTRYGPSDGFVLPGGVRKEARGIFADSQNRLWIGSFTPPMDVPHNGGLLLFEDGQFKTISKEVFPLHNVSGMFESSDGAIWFSSLGYQSDGYNNNYSWIARYKDNEFEVFDDPGACMNIGFLFKEKDGLTLGIIEDLHGDLWFLCNGKTNASTMEREGDGLFRYNGDVFERINRVSDNLVDNVQLNDLFYDHKTDELYATFQKQPGFALRDIPNLVMVHRNGEWQYEKIVSSDQLAGLVEKDYDAEDLLFILMTIRRAESGRLIASLFSVDPATNRLFGIVFSNDGNEWNWMDIFPGFIVTNLYGDVFMTAHSDPDVIGIYTPPYSQLLTEDDGLLKSPTDGGQLFTDNDGNVWLTYQNSWDAESRTWNSVGVSKWDGDQIKNYTIADGFSSNTLYQPIQSTDGTLWFPTDRGVNRVVKEGDDYRFTNFYGDGRTPFRATNVLETTNGEIYAYVNFVAPETDQRPEFTFFLGRFNGEYFESYDPPYPDSLLSYPYHSYELSSDRDNRLWLSARFANSNNGLFTAVSHLRVLQEGKWIDPSVDWHIPDTRLFFVGELHNGLYYIVDGGFYKFDFELERFVDLTDSVDANADFRILQRVNTAGMQFHIEGKDYLYIRFRDMGIAVFDGINLTYLDRRNGLPSLRLLYPNRDRNGDILLTTPTGGVIFSGTEFTSIRDEAVTGGTPRAIARDKYNNILILYLGMGMTVTRMDTTQYPVRIASIRTDTLRFFERQPARLKSNQNNIEFRFATMNFANPEEVRFSYYLEGFDREWSGPTRVNYTDYRNLPPGNYSFKVRSVSPGNIHSEAAVFEFTVDPPWWRTTAAYGIYFFLFIGLLYSVDRLQRRRLIARERERTREKEIAHAQEIKKAYEDLKAAQRQLVQQEKLASLGQLTAGIAHEIKNPLNFVNNFSTISIELLDELMEDLQKAQAGLQNGEISDVLNDVKINLSKIHEHGTRADNIVKSMLLHSRGKSGEKIPTDLNSLLDEYVKLAYHGMRAVDKSFNIDIQTDYDKDLPKLDIVPQDVSRAFLNILNNGMYAASEYAQSQDGRKPVISVQTRRLGNSVEIRIKDNGHGISEEIREKIFEPFFTTKPTGAGTGLGLSMTYDIIKLHDGKLKVNSQPGEFTEFIVELPIINK